MKLKEEIFEWNAFFKKWLTNAIRYGNEWEWRQNVWFIRWNKKFQSRKK